MTLSGNAAQMIRAKAPRTLYAQTGALRISGHPVTNYGVPGIAQFTVTMAATTSTGPQGKDRAILALSQAALAASDVHAAEVRFTVQI